MERIHTHRRRLWMTAILGGLLIAGGIGLARIEPVGKKADVIQFDVISELNMDVYGDINWVVFTRYWVCRDYYAACVLWSEPHGQGMMNMKTLRILSDGTSFRMDDEAFSYWVPTNTTYPKPLGGRGPFRWGGLQYEAAEMRFAEAEALSRRVYASDLNAVIEANDGAESTIDVRARPGAVRKLAQLKVRATGGKIESMELLDAQRQSLGKMNYEYERQDKAAALKKLIGELPVSPQKLAMDVNVMVVPAKSGPAEVKASRRMKDVDHVYHKGGRTCSVTYADVAVGDRVLRLPTSIEVRVSVDKRLVRSARLMNFKRVDLDKAGVWAAAKAFGGLSSEDQACERIASKYLRPEPKREPMRMDPNDLAAVRRLIAKYPLPSSRPREPSPMGRGSRARAVAKDPNATPQERMESRQAAIRDMKEAAVRDEQQKAAAMMVIDPNDYKAIQQLIAHYRSVLHPPLTPEQEALVQMRDAVFQHEIPEQKREIEQLYSALRKIVREHRAPDLPVEKPPQPEMEPDDLESIHQLQGHFEKLAQQDDRGPGGRFKAIDALIQLDKVLKDYDAFERHTARYLQMLQDSGLPDMYMVGAHANLATFVAAGEFERANKLTRQWATTSAGRCDPDAVFRFVHRDWEGSSGDPWASIQLLDQFLKKSGLSQRQRYEGLALRAIALDKLDKMLADPKADQDELGHAQIQWISKTSSRAQIAGMVEPAVRQAVSAWGTLGSARLTDAMPYAQVGGFGQNIKELPDSTRLQEVSAQLNQIVNERKIQMQQTAPGPRATPRPAPRGRRGG